MKYKIQLWISSEIVVEDDNGTEIEFLPLETFDVLIYRGDDVSEAQAIIDKQAWPGHSTDLNDAIQSELEEYLKGARCPKRNPMQS